MQENNHHIATFFSQVKSIADLIDKDQIDLLAKALLKIRENDGRLFFLGVGGECRELFTCCK